MSSNDLERRVADLEATVASFRRTAADAKTGDTDRISRRAVLRTLGIAGLGSYAVGKARGDPQGQLGTADRPVKTIYAERLAGGLTDSTPVTSLAGRGLSVENETLRAALADATNAGDGEELLGALSDGTLTFRTLVAGSNVSLSSSSDEVTIDASGASGQTTASNVGTGDEWFKRKSGDDLEFRTLLADGTLSATQGTDEVTIQGPWVDNGGLLQPRSGAGYTGVDLSGVTDARVVTPWVGTTGADAFEVFVNDGRVALFETEGLDPDDNAASGNVLLGRYASVTDDPVGATVGGGGSSADSGENVVTDDYGVVGGGESNQAGDGEVDSDSAVHPTVGGGFNNTAAGSASTVAGGDTNRANGSSATVGGGFDNTADGASAAVGGGKSNKATGNTSTIAGGDTNIASGPNAVVAGGGSNAAGGGNATVPGGNNNAADGDYSFAAGRNAKANNRGSFVWADDGADTFASDQSGTQSSPTGANTFHVRSTGGIRFVTGLGSDNTPNAGVYLGAGGSSWETVSARSSKHDVTAVDPDSVLEHVSELDVYEWAYNANPDVTHMGPMAGDFHETFGLGSDAETIGHVDIDGVALAAIQGLASRVEDLRTDLENRDERVETLEESLSRKSTLIDSLEVTLADRNDRIAELKEALDATEQRVDRLASRLDALEDADENDSEDGTETTERND